MEAYHSQVLFMRQVPNKTIDGKGLLVHPKSGMIWCLINFEILLISQIQHWEKRGKEKKSGMQVRASTSQTALFSGCCWAIVQKSQLCKVAEKKIFFLFQYLTNLISFFYLLDKLPLWPIKWSVPAVDLIIGKLRKLLIWWVENEGRKGHTTQYSDSA